MAETEINVIDTAAELPRSQDYTFLRDQALRYIEQFSSKVWTDLNTHDPGITILEQVCFALTDLGLRAENNFVDLITEDPTSKDNTGDYMFHTAAEALPCNPWTALDMRKLLIDIEGVRNAWFLPVPEADNWELGSPLVVRYNSNSLEESLDLNKKGAHTHLNSLKGLYNIVIEPETDADIASVVAQVESTYHAHRNVCEDVWNITSSTGIQQVYVDATFDFEPGVDQDIVLANIGFAFQQYLEPNVRYRNLRQMLDLGYTIDKIFEGPRLQHGFLEDSELQRLDRQEYIFASDFIAIAMQIEGVHSVISLKLGYTDDASDAESGTLASDDDKSCIPLSKHYTTKVVFSLANSTVTVKSGPNTLTTDQARVSSRIVALQLRNKIERSAFSQEDLPVPEGEYTDLETYFAVQNELPDTYGTSLAGLPLNATEERKAQAKQLRSYLMFFEQTLANYFSQLANVKTLLSWRSAPDRTTYFVQEVQNIIDPSDLYVGGSLDVSVLFDSESLYAERKNRILDHLMARFNERITDYSLVLFQRNALEELGKQVDVKINFLQKYPLLSRDRARAFNYRAGNSEVWNTTNVSGYKERTAALLGMSDVRRRFLFTGHDVNFENLDSSPYFVMRMSHNGLSFDITGTAKSDFNTAADAFKAMATESGQLAYVHNGNAFEVRSNDQSVLYGNSPTFLTSDDRDDAIQAMADYWADRPFDDYEGFHVIEHLLIRPRTTGRTLLDPPAGSGSRNFLQPILDAGFSTDDVVIDGVAGEIVLFGEAQRPLKPFGVGALLTKAEWLEQVGLAARNPNNYEILYKQANFPSTAAGWYIRLATDQDVPIATMGEPSSSNSWFTPYSLANDRVAQLVYFANTFVDGWIPDHMSEGWDNPYSSQMTVLLPSFMLRARDPIFRQSAEKIFKLEAPAHVSVDVLWIEDDALQAFEFCYYQWLEDMDANSIDPTRFDSFANKFKALETVFEAIYIYEEPKTENLYIAHEKLATLDFAGGAAQIDWISASPAGGTPDHNFVFNGPGDTSFIKVGTGTNADPSGINIGDIYLDDKDLSDLPIDRFAIRGNYSLRLYIRAGSGAIDERIVYITILPELEVTYTIAPTNYNSCYAAGSVLAAVDAGAGVTAAALRTGSSLPLGTELITDNSQQPTYNAGDIIIKTTGDEFQTTSFTEIEFELVLNNDAQQYAVVNFDPENLLPKEPPPTDNASVWFQEIERSYPLNVLGIVSEYKSATTVEISESVLADGSVLVTIPGHPSTFGNVSSVETTSGPTLSDLNLAVTYAGGDASIVVANGSVDDFIGDFKAHAASDDWELTNFAGRPNYIRDLDLQVGFSNICSATISHPATIRIRRNRPTRIVWETYDPSVANYDNAVRFKPADERSAVPMVSFTDKDGGVTLAEIIQFSNGQGETYADGQAMLNAYGLYMLPATGAITLGKTGTNNAETSFQLLVNKLTTPAVISNGKATLYVKIKFTDAEGGITRREINFQFRGQSDLTADARPLRPVHGYGEGEILVELKDSQNIGIQSVQLRNKDYTETSDMYYLPFGVTVHKTTGDIRVASGKLIEFWVPPTGVSTGVNPTRLPTLRSSDYAANVLNSLYNDSEKVGDLVEAYRDIIEANAEEDDPFRDITYRDIFTRSRLTRDYKESIDWWEVFLQFAPDTSHPIFLTVTNVLGITYDINLKLNIPSEESGLFKTNAGTAVQSDFGEFSDSQITNLATLMGADRRELMGSTYTGVTLAEGTFEPTGPLVTGSFNVNNSVPANEAQVVVASHILNYANEIQKLGGNNQPYFVISEEGAELRLKNTVIGK